ncbi:Uncharacterised protein [Mycobacteroides abscessus subsp. abscessus]|nr:Uncharacterised protein [Mycobacteroides abscessus subsp. abscessus]
MHTKVIAPLLSRAIRQLLTSSTEEATSRPASPPTVVPAMYLPIAEPSDPGCTSSAKNAIDPQIRGECRQHRLGSVERRESRQSRGEQRTGQAPVTGGTCLMG